jgi:hypothetical protein
MSKKKKKKGDKHSTIQGGKQTQVKGETKQ